MWSIQILYGFKVLLNIICHQKRILRGCTHFHHGFYKSCNYYDDYQWSSYWYCTDPYGGLTSLTWCKSSYSTSSYNSYTLSILLPYGNDSHHHPAWLDPPKILFKVVLFPWIWITDHFYETCSCGASFQYFLKGNNSGESLYASGIWPYLLDSCQS